MKNQKTLQWLIPLIGVLALFAASAGFLWPGDGEPYPFVSVQGEQVMINGRGLYRYDTVSSAAQMQANDLITLVLGLPLLVVSSWLAFRGSLRGRLLLAGTLGFFLYTYMSMCFATAFNPLFLVYLAIFSLSLIAFVLSLMAFDLAELPGRFSGRLPRRGIAGVLFAGAGFLLLAWVGGRILPPLLQGQTPLLENTTTMVIQVLDLGLIFPLSVLGGVLLLRRDPWGYLLASVSVMKFITMGAAVSAMAFNMLLSGVSISPVELGMFPALTLVNLAFAVQLLKNVDARPAVPAPAL